MNTPITDSVGRELGRLAASYRCGDLDAAAYARQADQVLQRVAELELVALKLQGKVDELTATNTDPKLETVNAPAGAEATPVTDAVVLPMTIDGIFLVPAKDMRKLERANAALKEEVDLHKRLLKQRDDENAETLAEAVKIETERNALKRDTEALLVERDGAKALLDKATALCTKQGEDITALRAKLATEQELRQAAQQDFADLCAFLRGAPPQTYRLHVKEVADKALALVNSYDRAHRLFDVNLVELLQRCQNGEATCIYTAQIIEAELDKLRTEITRLKHEIQTDSWSREMQEALQSIPAQFVKNDYWVNGIKRMADELARLQADLAKTLELGGFAYFAKQRDTAERQATAYLNTATAWKQRVEDATQLLDRLTQVSPWREGSDSVRRCEYCNAVDHDGTETHHSDCPWAQARAATKEDNL
jgi:hypothetical protein